MLNRRGGIECDFTVSRLAEDRFGIVTGTAFGRHDLAWIRRHAGRRARRGRDVLVGVHRSVGAAGARRPGRRLHRRPVVRLHALGRADGRRRAGAGAAGHLRRRARLGAVLPDGVRRRAVEHAVGGGPRTGCGGRLPGDRLAAAGEGLPRVGRRHHARRHAVRGRARVRVVRQGLPRPFGARRGAGAAAVLPRARGSALGGARQRARAGGEAVGRVTSGASGYTVERSIAYAYLPSSSASPGTEVAVEIFGEWVGGEVVEEPLWIPRGAGPVCNMLLHVHRGHQGPHRGGDRELPAAGAGTRQAQARRRARAAGRGDIQLFRVEVPGRR